MGLRVILRNHSTQSVTRVNVATVSVAGVKVLESQARALPTLVKMSWTLIQCRIQGGLIECEQGGGEIGKLASFRTQLREVKTIDYQYTKYILSTSFR